VPTFFRTVPFLRDWSGLTPDQKAHFKIAVSQMVEDLRAHRGFRPGLRVKRVRKTTGIFEITWAPNGRATFEYGAEVYPGEPHIIWRRIGTHDIFQSP
jgi:hypothetical protein